MGEEAHNLGEQGLHMNGFDDSVPISISESKTSFTINDKIYVITESGKGADSLNNVLIYFKSTSKWVTPTVLGTKPGFIKGHSAALPNTDRILIIKRDSEVNDCAWFLEVDTPFVREQKKTLGTEVVAWSKGVQGDGLVPVVISGPSGVGKGTLISKLMEEFPSTFGFSVSHTTRLPRQKEVDGVHYHFSERSKMEKDILSGKFLETASVHGNLYGTSIEAVETVTDSGRRCILDIDVQGARSVKNSTLEAIFVFIAPPSFDELEKRLRARGTETEEQVKKRLRNAMIELKEGKSSGLFDYILINDNLQTCYESIKKILGLDGAINGSCQPRTKSEVSVCDKTDQKFVIQCQCKSNEIGNGSKDMERFVLDVSSLKGGAPGRTRGLKIEVSNQFVDVPTKVL